MKILNFMKKLFIFFFLFPSVAEAHTFTGMIGFYDGISHPVLGFDHFLAMVSVGIISAQIGGRAIWSVPLTFVMVMILGGITGISAETYKGFNEQAVTLDGLNSLNNFLDYLYLIIEYGIIFSVILLGFAIAIKKQIPINIVMIFVAFFGLCHGTAHGLEMPWAANPILFALGFASGTAVLHLFGVVIGYFSIKTYFSSLLLRITGSCFALYGVYLLFLI